MTRLRSIDVMRGAVMVLMAIDHVRVYSGLPAGGPTPGIFFTRWITHFVAPGFAFLAGTAAFLYGRKIDDRGALARYLVTRGVLLVLLELTVIRVFWTFNLDFAHYVLAGVIWMLGVCMVLLAALVWLPTAAIAAIGFFLVFGQQVFGMIGRSLPEWLATFIYFGGPVEIPGVTTIGVLYSIVPWIGVMALGYAFGDVMEREPAARRRICLQIGLSAIAMFLLLRGTDVWGDPRHWRSPAEGPMKDAPAYIRFLNTSKYPASPSFLLMTLGPLIALLPLAERLQGRVANALSAFGRVPLFYYLLHIPLIHLFAIGVSLIREGRVDPWLFENHPLMVPPPPPGYTWSLELLYAVFAIAIVVLYVPCRWYANVKARRPNSVLRYL